MLVGVSMSVRECERVCERIAIPYLFGHRAVSRPAPLLVDRGGSSAAAACC